MNARSSAIAAVTALGAFPGVARAQYVPPWLIAAVLSPILVIGLCVLLGILTRSFRIGALHVSLVMVWIVLFSLASYFVENDYVIWTPLALYTIHSLILLVLSGVALSRRLSGSGRGA